MTTDPMLEPLDLLLSAWTTDRRPLAMVICQLHAIPHGAESPGTRAMHRTAPGAPALNVPLIEAVPSPSLQFVWWRQLGELLPLVGRNRTIDAAPADSCTCCLMNSGPPDEMGCLCLTVGHEAACVHEAGQSATVRRRVAGGVVVGRKGAAMVLLDLVQHLQGIFKASTGSPNSLLPRRARIRSIASCRRTSARECFTARHATARFPAGPRADHGVRRVGSMPHASHGGVLFVA